MSRFGTFALGMSLGLLLAAGWNLAGPGPSRRSPLIQDLLDHHQGALGLDAATLAQSWAIANAAKAELDGLHGSIREERNVLEGLLDEGAVDPVAMADQVARIGALETQLRTRELETMLAIRRLLTAEQVQVLRGLPASPPPPSPR